MSKERLIRVVDGRGRTIKFVDLNTLSEYSQVFYQKPNPDQELLINKCNIDADPYLSKNLNKIPEQYKEITFKLRNNKKETLTYKFDRLDVFEAVTRLRNGNTSRDVARWLGYNEEAIEHLMKILEKKGYLNYNNNDKPTNMNVIDKKWKKKQIQTISVN